ncbi:MAG: hypothetical protein HYZ85_04240 [Candidatus Omnitrophica bacterium]|nr:hypothetical protein [Candidatus Omnitrophota bacterium]
MMKNEGKKAIAVVKVQQKKKSNGRNNAGNDDKKNTESDEKAGAAKKVMDAAGDLPFFHDEEGQPCVVIPVNSHWETYRMKNRNVRRWLNRQYYEKYRTLPSSEIINSVLSVLEGKAIFDGLCHKLSFRVAKQGDAFLYDVGDKQWRVIEITPSGWRFSDHPYVFQRGSNTAAQVEPVRGGDIRLVLKFLNLPKEGDKLLLLVMIVAALVPGIPHPVLLFIGEHGAAKSTSTKVVRRLVDPAVAELLSLPNKPDDMALLLHKNYCPALDNLDSLQGWQSDILCRAVSGGGIEKRRLYTDDDEVILKFLRFIILNGINPAVTRPDLIDRTTCLTLERIPDENRKQEADFWAEFDQAHPLIFGGMLDTLSSAMRIYPSVKLEKLPRMADFCKWGFAIAEALGGKGNEFFKAYRENISHQNKIAIENHPVASAIKVFFDGKSVWQGRPSDLLTELEKVAAEEKIDMKAKSWPKAAHILTRRLNAIKTNLMGIGIRIITGEHTGDNRMIRLEEVKQNSVSSGGPPEDDPDWLAAANASDEGSVKSSVSPNPMSDKAFDATDANNAVSESLNESGDEPDWIR